MFPVKVQYPALVSTMRGVVALLVMCHVYEHAYNSLETCFSSPNGMWGRPTIWCRCRVGTKWGLPQWVLKYNVDGVARRKLDLTGIGGVLAMLGGNLDVFSEGVVMRDSNEGFEDLLSLFLG